MLRMDGIAFSGCGSAWLEHLVWDQGVAGSNPVTPTMAELLCACFCGKPDFIRVYRFFSKTVDKQDEMR